MIRVQLPKTDLTISRLGFGTASLHHLIGSRQRYRLLATAVDCGITHFDTARMYGEGMAERSLGRFMSSQRAAFTLASKIGFSAHPMQERVPVLLYAARAAMIAKRVLRLRSNPRPRGLSPKQSERSLHATLRALQTDWLDLLLVHEPLRSEIEVVSELSDWLILQKRLGRVRWLGLSGDAQECIHVANAVPGVFDVLQLEDSLGKHEADVATKCGWPLQLTFGYFRGYRTGGKRLDGVSAKDTLVKALARNASGAILISSRRPARIRELTSVVEDRGPD